MNARIPVAPGKNQCRRSDGFDSAVFSRLADREVGHFWFTCRNRIIIWVLKHYFHTKLSKFLELGCGTGFVLSGIEKSFTSLYSVGCDTHAEAFVYTNKRLSKARLILADGRRLPFKNSFDVVGAFDVLEHIPEDTEVLREINSVLTPGGGIILTVPQHKFLYSYTDVIACHVRRYNAAELKEKVLNCGFEILDMFSFVSILFPMVVLRRLIWFKKNAVESGELPELAIPKFLNTFLSWILHMECFLTRKGIRFNWGTSLVLVGRKI